MDIAAFYLIFLGVSLAVLSAVRGVEPTAVAGVAAAQVVGFVAFFFASLTLSATGDRLYEEISHGTLEQLLLAPLGTLRIVLVRFLAALTVQSMFAVPLTALLIATTGARIAFTPHMVIVFVCLMVGVLGMALFLGGLILLTKRVGQLPFIFQVLFLGLGMSSVANLPEAFQRASVALPFARGVGLLQELAGGDPLAAGWGEISLLVLNGTSYFVAGILFFAWAERTAKHRGLLGRY